MSRKICRIMSDFEMADYCPNEIFGASGDVPSSNKVLGSPGGSPSQT